jgi:hypothetical protein
LLALGAIGAALYGIGLTEVSEPAGP